MSGGGGAAAVAAVVASSSGEDISAIPSNFHLFFDDDVKYISDVNTAVGEHNKKPSASQILLQSIQCHTGQVELIEVKYRFVSKEVVKTKRNPVKTKRNPMKIILL